MTDIGELLDEADDGVLPCEECGCKLWMIDGDREGNRWLLCMGEDCDNTKPLPNNGDGEEE